MIDTNTSLGDLAATGTDARSVLLRYQLDFCCGGGRSLATACEAAGLDLDQVVAELEVAANRGSDSVDWRERSVEELVEHILERYHRPLPDHIDSVLAAAEKVLADRGAPMHYREITRAALDGGLDGVAHQVVENLLELSGAGLVEVERIEEFDFAVDGFGQQGVAIGQASHFDGHFLSPALGALGEGHAPAAKDVGIGITAAGVARAFLAVEFAAGVSDLGAAACFGGALPAVGVVADIRLLEQLGANLTTQKRLVDRKRIDLLAGLIVYRYLDHLWFTYGPQYRGCVLVAARFGRCRSRAEPMRLGLDQP